MPRRIGHLPAPSRARMLMITTAALATLLPLPARAQNEPIPGDVAASVDRGLAWLAKNQESDGRWSASGGTGHSTAITGLCAMAFMARGHVPGQGPYGDNLNRAIDFVLASQRNDGLFARESSSGPMYDHGICTIMLCEAYGMLDDRRQEAARGAINRAVALILRAQRRSKPAGYQGGWRYSPTSDDSDLSVSGWQLMALRAAANAGANVPPDSIEQGIRFVLKCAQANGTFSYMGTGAESFDSSARTGIGVLSLILMGKEDDPHVKAGASQLARGLRDDMSTYYSYYYGSQAAWQVGGITWTQVNAEVSSELRRRQRRDGSWAQGEGLDAQGGTNYSTAMAVLALTVPYRYLPIYQR